MSLCASLLLEKYAEREGELLSVPSKEIWTVGGGGDLDVASLDRSSAFRPSKLSDALSFW